jgi:predicted O-linked N-acetylglucosamine transferase (SPINDLY family)
MKAADADVGSTFERALALYHQGRLRDAWGECRRIAAVAPNHAPALHLGGVILLDSGHFAEAAAELQRSLAIDRTSAGAWLDLARAFDKTGRTRDALHARHQALHHAPGDAAVFASVAAGFLESGCIDEAVETAKAACRLSPENGSAWFNLALALQASGRAEDARAAGATALRLLPDEPRAIGLAAQLDAEAGDLIAARGRLVEAVSRFPNVVALSAELGHVATRLGDLTLAADAYRSVLAADPESGAALTQLIFIEKRLARWDGLPALQRRFATAVAARRPWMAPFTFLSDPSTRAEQRLCAETWGRAFLPRESPSPRPIPEQTSLRLRIGYLSGDFYQHPTSVLLAGVLEHHDRARFEIYAYSTGPDDRSAMRERIAAAVERFIDVRGLDPEALAKRIRADRIDLLVDLKGYTEGGALAALALRPAPVQAHWVGYPGTLAVPYIDYLIADQIVVPPAHTADYGEAIAWLPGSYQPNDRAREVAVPPARDALGLPREGVVLCAFNALWKITPGVFDAWAEILKRVPGSVLWLLATGHGDSAVVELRRAARSRGVDPDRVHFATRRVAPDYLALYRHADVFLDTWPYNAHTTAADALWMGVPIVTWLGETFAGRVAASLLTALGMHELVGSSVGSYIEMAVALASDRTRRDSLRRRIEAARYTSSLFDARATARAVESAYRTMVHQRRTGHRESFLVTTN